MHIGYYRPMVQISLQNSGGKVNPLPLGPGGALTLEMGTGMCRGHDPLFSGQSPLPSLPIYRQCSALETPFSIFRKFLHFQPCFGQNSSSLDPFFSKFSLPRPPFFKENPLPRPYILKPAWHTSTKKKVACPPPPPASGTNRSKITLVT